MTPNSTSTNGSRAVDNRFRMLEASDTAMLLIDHQVGTMLFGITDIDPVNLRNNTLMLAQGAKVHDLPVILTASNPGGTNGPIFKELTDLFPHVPVIDRLKINAWEDPTFVSAVRATGRHQLIIAGVTTDVCLTFPAISAAGAGYDVYAVIDASGTFNQHSLLASIARMSQAGVKVADCGMVISELQRDWSLPTALATEALLGERVPNAGYIAQNLYRAVPEPASH
jgi:nicotinamidase-related amidase